MMASIIKGQSGQPIQFETKPNVNGDDVLTRTEIVGTVSESGGVPTGAIIQRGRNANGEWVRYADGTQICTFVGVVNDFAISAAYGSLFQGSRIYTLPSSFVDGGYSVDAYARWGNGASWATGTTITTTACVLQAFDITSRATGTDTVIRYSAIGRWY